jgi:hypothetical protein
MAGDEDAGITDLSPKAPAPIPDKASSPARPRKWDMLSPTERRAWSAEIAAKETEARGLALIATTQQHREIAKILADAAKTGAKRSRRRPEENFPVR